MIWFAWRQFRTQALVTLGLLAACAVLVLVTGVHLHDLYSSLRGTRCQASAPCSVPPVPGVDRTLTGLLGPALLALPALLGIFWGAPLLARELESGTFRLAWTQSVTRRRWLTTKVLLIGAAALAMAGLASWLVSWWFAPLDALNMDRFDPGVFDARGIVAIGYAGFAFALGVAAGALTRRTLPAMLATLVGFIATRIAFTSWARPHLLPAKERLSGLTLGEAVGFIAGPSGVNISASPPRIPDAWTLWATLVDRAHHAVSAAQMHGMLLRYCPKLAAGLPKNPSAIHKAPAGLVGGYFIPCLHALSHHLQLLVAYQPPSHYWPLQGLETGIFLAAALALIAATVWRIGRRPTTRKPAAGISREQTAGPPAQGSARAKLVPLH